MIFVTVGTHEQPFDRLIEYVDRMKKEGILNEEVVIQTGFCTYEPQYSVWQRMYPYQEMIELVKEARIVVTHGGPSSFIMPLQMGKIPVVVPRQKKYNEHVNDHQMEFCREVASRQRNIIVVNEVDELAEILLKYDDLILDMNDKQGSNNQRFCKEFGQIVDDMFREL
jgi:UDP-N-acetylglucosamine transferase subunit ALG13